MVCPKYEEIGWLRRCTILPDPCHSCHGYAFWSCEVRVNLSPCHVPLQARQLLVMCDMGSLPELFLIPIPPQIVWYFIQGCLYANLWLISNYFSKSLTNCIQHSSLLYLMGKRCAAWWTGLPQAFVEVGGVLFLHWGRAEQHVHPVTLLVQQHGCAWFTAEERRDGHTY